MNGSLANSTAEEKSKKGNTVFKIPDIIGTISMVVNGTSYAFSRIEENSTTNSNKHDIASELSIKPYYNFNAFPSKINRKVIDKVEFDINDSEDSVEEKLLKSDSIKKPFKFSTYLWSSRQGKMFGSFALDQGAFLGIEYTEVNRGCVSTITVERKELRVKIGKRGIFSTLEDASNDTATSGTVSVIKEDKVSNLLDNIKNYTNSNKLYVPFFKNDNTFVREMAKSIDLDTVAELHSPFTAGSAANKIQNVGTEVDYPDEKLKYNGCDKFIIHNDCGVPILKKFKPILDKKDDNVKLADTFMPAEEELSNRAINFNGKVLNPETKEEQPLNKFNSEDYEERERKAEFLSNKGNAPESINKTPGYISKSKKSKRSYYEKYKKDVLDNCIKELGEDIDSQMDDYKQLVKLNSMLYMVQDKKEVRRIINGMATIQDNFIISIEPLLCGISDAVVKYGDVMKNIEKEECQKIFSEAINLIKQKGISLQLIGISGNLNTYLKDSAKIEQDRIEKFGK